jgi:hypothetical protein
LGWVPGGKEKLVVKGRPGHPKMKARRCFPEDKTGQWSLELGLVSFALTHYAILSSLKAPVYLLAKLGMLGKVIVQVNIKTPVALWLYPNIE